MGPVTSRSVGASPSPGALHAATRLASLQSNRKETSVRYLALQKFFESIPSPPMSQPTSVETPGPRPLDSRLVQHLGRSPGGDHHEPTPLGIHFDHAVRGTGGMTFQNGLHRLNGGDHLTIGGQIVVG